MSGVMLVYGKTRRKRSKLLTVLMFPALLFIGFLGLLMYIVGGHSGKHTKKAAKKPINKLVDNVTLIPTVYAEEQPQEMRSK